MAALFNLLIVQPIFNLLVLIVAILPGHNFGLAIIFFTIVIRLLMWPLVKKQLHHAKAMRELQPEMKRIKKEAKGDRQKESALMMEMYKEREVSPFGSIGILVIQVIILFGLYLGLTKVVNNPRALIDFSYPVLHDLSWMKSLMSDFGRFDESLLGIVDLTRPALKDGAIYVPALIIVALSAVGQYFQSIQLMPKPKDGRNLRAIMKDAAAGKQADQAEMSAALGRNMSILIPGMVFIFTIGLPSALSLYWLAGAVVAYIQQGRILKQDENEMEALADKPGKDDVIEGEVIESKTTPKKTKKPKKSSAKKRRKR